MAWIWLEESCSFLLSKIVQYRHGDMDMFWWRGCRSLPHFWSCPKIQLFWKSVWNIRQCILGLWHSNFLYITLCHEWLAPYCNVKFGQPWVDRNEHLVLHGHLGLSVWWRGGSGATIGPLLPDQRGPQGHTVQLLDIEKEEELQRVHRQLKATNAAIHNSSTHNINSYLGKNTTRNTFWWKSQAQLINWSNHPCKLSCFYLVPLLIELTFRRALGKTVCPLQPFLWTFTNNKVKHLKVEPCKIFWELDLSTGNVFPHGPAQNGEAAISCSHVDRHLAQVVQTEFGGWSHLQWN